MTTNGSLFGRWELAGHVVARAGHGTNDAPARVAADIGIAAVTSTDIANACTGAL